MVGIAPGQRKLLELREDGDMSEETTPWSIGTAGLYRRAGQELAADPSNHSAAGVIIHGLMAEALYLRHTGTSASSLDEVRVQLLDHGAAACAAEQVGAYRTMCTATWVGQQEQWLHQRVRELALDPPRADTPEETAYRAAATQLAMLAYGPGHDLCYAVVAGAAAVARLRRWSSSIGGDIEDQIEAEAKTDTLTAVAWANLPADHREGPTTWVFSAWDEIQCAAREQMTLTTVMDAPVTVEQRVAIARHEVRHGLLRNLRGGFGGTGDRVEVCNAAIEYTESAAEALVRWEADGGDPAGADAAMLAHVDADPVVIATEVGTLFTARARDRLRGVVRERWAQLAPPA